MKHTTWWKLFLEAVWKSWIGKVLTAISIVTSTSGYTLRELPLFKNFNLMLC